MKLITIALLSVFAVAAQDKTYDLKMEAKPVKGHKSDLTESMVMKMTMKITGVPDAMNLGEENNYAATEEILSAEADGSSERKWKFTKATQNKEGQNVALGFQGKTVSVKHTKGKPREFAYEGGGMIAEEDMAPLKKAFMGGDDKPGKPSGADMFAPK